MIGYRRPLKELKPSGVPQDIWNMGLKYVEDGEVYADDEVMRILCKALIQEREDCGFIATCDCENPSCERKEIANEIAKPRLDFYPTKGSHDE